MDALYSFNVTSQISPDHDSIRVGDTILLQSLIPFQLQEQQTGATINYTNAKTIGSDIRIGRLENDASVSVDAVNDFNYFSTLGSIYNDRNIPSPDGVQQLRYEATGEGYQLKVGFVAKRTGVYAFGLGDASSNGRNSSHSCEKAAFHVSLTDTDQHVYYYEKWRPDYTLTNDDLQRIYCFKIY